MEWVGFVFGAMVGSFLNVCIHRLPAGESIAFPASHCPHCGPDPPLRQHPDAELSCCAAAAASARRRSRCAIRSSRLLRAASLPSRPSDFGVAGPRLRLRLPAALIVVTFIDLDHQIIPDAISLPGIVVGLRARPCCSASRAGRLVGRHPARRRHLLWVVAEGYERLTGREGMGGGDIKLLAMIGAFLGWQGVLVTLFIASLIGSLSSAGLMLRSAGA